MRRLTETFAFILQLPMNLVLISFNYTMSTSLINKMTHGPPHHSTRTMWLKRTACVIFHSLGTEDKESHLYQEEFSNISITSLSSVSKWRSISALQHVWWETPLPRIQLPKPKQTFSRATALMRWWKSQLSSGVSYLQQGSVFVREAHVDCC
jgi:hypothetical protein